MKTLIFQRRIDYSGIFFYRSWPNLTLYELMTFGVKKFRENSFGVVPEGLQRGGGGVISPIARYPSQNKQKKV